MKVVTEGFTFTGFYAAEREYEDDDDRKRYWFMIIVAKLLRSVRSVPR
ncbi:hypothetical protein Pla110_18480 [Polystyrenella longa]|uniref:Uncharacterized protein n=1 Tax=Polystyrenella longa TaxID=2528007 RepID=A0A518CLL6_9PLAN|nr:hypothetical protein Pla110_18480 [Polystyrenella longa]